MKIANNTVFISGGGSGIGRALAEVLHACGNQVIIAGRRRERLEVVTRANPGMTAVALDVTDSGAIDEAMSGLVADRPALNVLINCAGVMLRDDPAAAIDDADLNLMVATNLLGPIRLTSALIEHLKAQPAAAIVNVTSMLGFLPLAATTVYSATKAALHAFTLAQRYRLRGSSVEVIEIAPPYVQTELLDGQYDPRAMPLDAFITEALALLEAGEQDIFVARAKARRDALRPGENDAMLHFNDMMATV